MVVYVYPILLFEVEKVLQDDLFFLVKCLAIVALVLVVIEQLSDSDDEEVANIAPLSVHLAVNSDLF